MSFKSNRFKAAAQRSKIASYLRETKLFLMNLKRLNLSLPRNGSMLSGCSTFPVKFVPLGMLAWGEMAANPLLVPHREVSVVRKMLEKNTLPMLYGFSDQ